jgi:capsular exopolysaccharide synthesis family protein
MSIFLDSPILEEISRLHDNGQSGNLSLTNGKGERVDIFFREGMIDAVSSNLNGRRLGDYLLKQGQLQAQDIQAAKVEAQREKILFGEAVVRKRLVLQTDLGAAVRRQATDLLEHALKNEFQVDSFTSSLRSYYTPARISFSHVLLELSRSRRDLFEPKPRSRMVRSYGTDLSNFPWHPQELYVLSELKYPNTFENLIEATGLSDQTLKRILGVLDRLGVIETLDGVDAPPSQEIMLANAELRKSEFAFAQLIPVVTNAVLNQKIEVARAEFSFATEQFKNLKVQISEARPAEPPRVLTVTSPDAQAGKSLVSANLAFSFAMESDRRVIVIDCDLRSPSLGNYLGVTSEPGLLQYLSNGHLSPYCYVRRVENLYFLTAGGVAANPIEVLSMRKMRDLIESLKQDFDTIILDAPPCSPIADAKIITGMSDGLLLVIRRGKSTYSATDHAFKSIDRNKLLGVVFNDVQPMLFHTYHSYGYYSYGNKQTVYSSSERPKTNHKDYLDA